jgi:hypothetical protein
MISILSIDLEAANASPMAHWNRGANANGKPDAAVALIADFHTFGDYHGERIL